MADENSMRVGLEARDAAREDLLKSAIDMQKLAKFTVFSVHRGALAYADDKLQAAQETLLTALARVAQGPFPFSALLCPTRLRLPSPWSTVSG